MKYLKNILLYISAFVPMYCLILVRLILELANKNLTLNVLNTINFITLVLLICFGIFGLVWNVKFSSKKKIQVKILSKKNITDQHFLGYFSLFVFFAIPLDLSLVSAYCVYVLTLVMIGIVYINNSLFFINPLLNILGYNFYDITYVEVGKTEEKSCKIFYRGQALCENEPYNVNVKNQHFCFIDSHKK